MKLTHLRIFLSSLLLAGCGGTATGSLDARVADGSEASDAALVDGGTDVDGAIGPRTPDGGDRTDGGRGVDGGGLTDAAALDAGVDGAAADGGSCSSGLGAWCDLAACPSGYSCGVGRCAPQGRETCGGFVGAPCTDPTYTECVYFTGADYGTCLSRAELTCVCSDPRRSEGVSCR